MRGRWNKVQAQTTKAHNPAAASNRTRPLRRRPNCLVVKGARHGLIRPSEARYRTRSSIQGRRFARNAPERYAHQLHLQRNLFNNPIMLSISYGVTSDLLFMMSFGFRLPNMGLPNTETSQSPRRCPNSCATPKGSKSNPQVPVL